MHEFVDEGFLFLLSRLLIVDFRHHLDGVGWRKVQNPLPNLAQPVDARDCAACLAALAAHAEDKLGNNMVEFAFLRKLVDLHFDFGGIVVFYRQTVSLPF